MSFALSQVVTPAKVFIERKANVTTRWDPFYYRPELVALEKRVTKVSQHRLRDFVRDMAGGATPSTKEADTHYTEGDDGVPFIRVQNLSTTGRLDLEGVKRITRSTHEGLLRRSRLSGGELLVKITGVGRMAVSSVVPEGFEGNINQHIVGIDTDDIKTSETLAAYLNLDMVERLASRRSTGGTRPALDYPALLSIPIVFDERILDLMNVAVDRWQQRIEEAGSMLATIDNLLFDELGITRQPERPNTLESRVFHRQLRELSGDRFDPDYYRASYRRILAGIGEARYPLAPLGSVCALIANGKTPARLDYSEEETVYPLIKVASYSRDEIDLNKVGFAVSHQPRTAKKGDIFVLAAAHQPGFVGRFVKYLALEPTVPTSFVGELICVRADESVLAGDYLYALLSCSIFQTLLNREKRGQTSHIYPRDICKLQIPVPQSRIDQDRIAQRVTDIRERAKGLLAQACSDLEQAKRDIEALILGKEVAA